jgi:hypothetical protein
VTAESMSRSVRKRVGCRDRGTAALEAAALLPIVLFVGTLLLQLGVAVWTTVAADTAARSAARAVTLGRDGVAAANSSLPGSLRVSPSNIDILQGTDDVRVTLRLNIPRVSLLPVFTVQRDAVMPDIRP